MLAFVKRSPRGAIVAGLILAFTVVAVYRATAGPNYSPPGFRSTPPSEPQVPQSASRFPDDIRFVRPNDRNAMSNQMNGSASGSTSGIAGGLGGLGGAGGGFGGAGGGAGGGGFFGQGRAMRIVGGDPMNPMPNDGFYGTFNFGGFKGYGFGGGDMQATRQTDKPALGGAASQSKSD